MITKNINIVDNDMFNVVDLEGSEVVKFSYSKQIDDIMISCKGGDILMRWDYLDWDDNECMLLKEHDNFKEINSLRCTHLLLKSESGSKVKVYVVAQLN